MKLVLLIFCAVALLIVVSGIYVFIFACVRRKEPNWLCESALANSPYIKFSKLIREADNWLRTHSAQDVWIQSEDGLKLHGLWVPADKPIGTVLFSHGYRSCSMLDFCLAFPLYHEMGLNLLIPDQRAHGRSEGRYITFGVKESKDIQCWITYHNETFGSYPVILNGLSMGASAVLYLADRNLPQNVKGIVADCGFTTPREIIGRVFSDVTHLSIFPSILVTDICAQIFAHFRLDDCDTKKSLSASRLPIILIHGKDDGYVPCDMSVQAYDFCCTPKQMLLVDGADHGMSFLIEPEKYTQFVTEFLKTNLHEWRKEK